MGGHHVVTSHRLSNATCHHTIHLIVNLKFVYLEVQSTQQVSNNHVPCVTLVVMTCVTFFPMYFDICPS